MTAATAILLFVTLERLAELWLARSNTARLRAAGAVEYGRKHYPVIVGVHAAWLIGLWILAWNAPVSWGWLAVFVVLQAGRIWVIATLGRRWTTRIIVPPEAPLVRHGPYRFAAHPNYIVVVGEIAVLPLVFAMPLYALAFTLLNGAVLAVRIRAENEALRARQDGA